MNPAFHLALDPLVHAIHLTHLGMLAIVPVLLGSYVWCRTRK